MDTQRIKERLLEVHAWAEPKADAFLIWLGERRWSSVAIVAIAIALVLAGFWICRR